MKKGKLYLIPTPLGPDGNHAIPPYAIAHLHQMNYIIAERGKTVRAFMKTTKPTKAFQEITFFELNKFTDKKDIPSFLTPMEEGHDVGLLSEAGCPGVADPGAVIVEMAHQKGIEVVPLVGPSSILLALMGSGMNGQSFCFHGYLPQKKPAIGKSISKLEQMAIRHKQAQIFIETPYRNNPLFQEAIKILEPTTKFCVATNLTLETQSVVTKTIGEWKKGGELPDLHKKPTVFIIGHSKESVAKIWKK